jgi:hypothetical protein
MMESDDAEAKGQAHAVAGASRRHANYAEPVGWDDRRQPGVLVSRSSLLHNGAGADARGAPTDGQPVAGHVAPAVGVERKITRRTNSSGRIAAARRRSRFTSALLHLRGQPPGRPLFHDQVSERPRLCPRSTSGAGPGPGRWVGVATAVSRASEAHGRAGDRFPVSWGRQNWNR